MVRYCKKCNTALPVLWKREECMNCISPSNEAPIIKVMMDVVMIIVGAVFVAMTYIVIAYIILKFLVYIL